MESLSKRIGQINTLETALVLVQPDGAEQLPDPKWANAETIDFSLFADPVHDNWKTLISGNKILSEKWKKNISAAGDLKKVGPDHPPLSEKELYQLKLGEILLKFLRRDRDIPLPPFETGPLPPGLLSARTVGVALMMFQNDDTEGNLFQPLQEGKTIDVQLLHPESKPRKTFEKWIAQNEPLNKDWNQTVVLIYNLLHPKKSNTESDTISFDDFQNLFGENTTDRDNASAYLRLGVELMRAVEADARPWARTGTCREIAIKPVLADDTENSLGAVPFDWFQLLAKSTDMRIALDPHWYPYLLHGGFERGTTVSYRELAAIASIGEYHKGFLTDAFYGLSGEKRSRVQGALNAIGQSASWSEWEYQEPGHSPIGVTVYVDTLTPFAEISLKPSEGPDVVLRSSRSLPPEKSWGKYIFQDAPEMPLDEIRKVVAAIQKSFHQSDARLKRGGVTLRELFPL